MRVVVAVMLTAAIGSVCAAQPAADAAHAQADPSTTERTPAAAPARIFAAEPAHGWLVLPSTTQGSDESDARQTEPAARLLHAPPRTDGVDIRGEAADAEPGVLRTSRPLRIAPIAHASYGSNLYMVFENPDRPHAPRSVQSLRAVPAGVSGLWTELPPTGFDPLPPLPEGGEIDAFAAGPAGPIVALRDGVSLRVCVPSPEAWRELASLTLSPHERVRGITAEAERAQLLVDGPNGGRVLTLPIVRASDDDSVAVTELPWKIGLIGDDAVVLGAEPGFVVLASDQAGVKVSIIDPAGQRTLATISSASAIELTDAAWTTLGGSSPRFIGVWRVPSDEHAGVELHTVELSLTSGEVLYDDSVRWTGPIGAGEYRLLAMALLAATITVLVIALRPAADTGVTLIPDGTALAEPGRRFFATLLDLLLAAFLVSRVAEVPMFEIISMAVLVRGDGAWVVLPMTFGVGASIGTLGEAVFARTPGKLLMGCAVVRAEPGEPRAIGLFGALLRNLIKWFLPPVAALAMIDSSGRHRGDTLAKSVVIVPVVPESEGGPPPDRHD